MNTCLRVLKETMDFVLLTCLLKFIEHFPDYLSVLSRLLLRSLWTTFVETAVYSVLENVAYKGYRAALLPRNKFRHSSFLFISK